ncbi:MAG TPA: lytic transglycosylase domain-containing protein [Bdellovibrionota bacterium]|nr:lytic transglycosylase domain-containing protein [Bdellovibrionota bacterium]
MMKYFSTILTWIGVAGLGIVFSTASMIQADPTDDFSFSLAHPPETDVYKLMPEARVAEILRDRLALFPKSQVPKLARHLIGLCQRYRFDPVFILSLIEVESSFRIKAVSPVGALGLMQIMPATAASVVREWGIASFNERALFDPFTNISIGIAYLAWLRDRYRDHSNYYLVAAYNAGPGKIDGILFRRDFKPVITKKYFENIRRHVPNMRFYQREQRALRGGSRNFAGV